MKPGLRDVTRALALVGLLVGVLDILASFRFGGGFIGYVLRWWAWTFAALQIVPVAGLLFTLSGGEVWTPAKKAGWKMWLVVMLPILFLGAVLAIAGFC